MRDPELTRRLWILGVGETALGMGVAGALGSRTGDAASLPPGLYEPMSNHLGHALQSVGRFHPIPPDSPTDYIKPRSGPFQPLFFSPSEFAVIQRVIQLLLGGEANPDNANSDNNELGSVVEEVAECIDLRVFNSAGIREAATSLDPMHRALLVAYHGAGTVHDLETFDAQKICRDGLAWLETQSRSTSNVDFLHLGENGQKQILTVISDEVSDRHVQEPGPRFFKMIKSEVIRGFYTSQTGLKELDFKGNAFHARSPDCKSG